ncbi:uncharacterized protein LOC136074589 [Hydra vulgaris]|uniref:Uncharacterized protein LOC136074589 n=1 Tax=Hydra vulgaris TaxID=6087 RepID=A0ABM4B2K6_HYDVU
MFLNLNSVIGNNILPEVIKTEIVCHLDNLINEFGNFFLDVNLLSSEVIISPFSCDVKNVKEEAQEELIELKNDTMAKDHFKITPLNNYWLKMSNSYPLCLSIALRDFIPFQHHICSGDFDLEDEEHLSAEKKFEDTELEPLLNEDLCQTQEELT